MGAVYEAVDPAGQRRAVKMLLELTGKEEALRFAREARIMSTLSHPNLTRIVESGVDSASGSPYLVMDLLSGEDIDSLLQRCGPFPPALAARVVVQACAGIAAAHAGGSSTATSSPRTSSSTTTRRAQSRSRYVTSVSRSRSSPVRR